jgi:polysaccharide pyruvyl transferase WcaK-like protein
MDSARPLTRPPEAGSAAAQRRSRGSRRILLFNVKYSPNLGDGLLAECLECEIRSQLGDVQVNSLDLAGRPGYAPGRADRALALSILHASPLFVRQATSKLVLGSFLRRRLRPLWREKLRGVHAVIVGGGNLVSDSDLNFPLKLRTAMAVARELGAPVGVFAVGVSDNWSAQGAAMFSEALAGGPLFFTSVRDTRSAEIWTRRLGPSGAAPPKIVSDPGLLAYAHFPASVRPARAAPLVGVGVMHPVSLKYHSDWNCVSAARQKEWNFALVNACLAQGWTVRLFTNGSPEDEAYLKSVAPALVALDATGRISVEPRFATPGELARFIAGLDLMYAHRLHANIAAYSYAVPHIGFSWDTKLKSFLAQVGRGQCLATVGVDAIDEAVQLGLQQLQTGVDRERHRAVLKRAHADVADLSAAVKDAQPIPSADAWSAST